MADQERTFPPLPPKPVRRERAGLRRVLWWAGLALIVGITLLPGVFKVPPFNAPMWIIGPVVIPFSYLVVASLILGMSCWVTCFVLRSAANAGRPPIRFIRNRDLRSRLHSGTVAAITFITALWAIPFTLLMVGLASTVSFFALTPASQAGCRVVVQDAGGFGSIYVSKPSSLVLTETGKSWRQDSYGHDEYHPIKAGTWSLAWKEESAQLLIWGPYDTHASPGPITCHE